MNSLNIAAAAVAEVAIFTIMSVGPSDAGGADVSLALFRWH